MMCGILIFSHAAISAQFNVLSPQMEMKPHSDFKSPEQYLTEGPEQKKKGTKLPALAQRGHRQESFFMQS